MIAKPTHSRSSPAKILSTLFALVMGVYIVVPFLWMLTASFRPPSKTFSWPPKLLPLDEVSLENYRTIFQKVDLSRFIFNSIKVSVLTTSITLISASLAAFAFARLRFKSKDVLFIVFLSALMIPGQVLGIPRFIIMSKVGLINNHAALYLPSIFNVFGIFLIRQYMLTIPRSYDEAAYIDGASVFYCYRSIILPMSKPVLMVVGLQTFIGSWNDFYNPLIYINNESRMTLPLGLTALRGMLDSTNQAVLIASVMLTTIAPLIFYIFGQRYLEEGIQIGGIKS